MDECHLFHLENAKEAGLGQVVNCNNSSSTKHHPVARQAMLAFLSDTLESNQVCQGRLVIEKFFPNWRKDKHYSVVAGWIFERLVLWWKLCPDHQTSCRIPLDSMESFHGNKVFSRISDMAEKDFFVFLAKNGMLSDKQLLIWTYFPIFSSPIPFSLPPNTCELLPGIWISGKSPKRD